MRILFPEQFVRLPLCDRRSICCSLEPVSTSVVCKKSKEFSCALAEEEGEGGGWNIYMSRIYIYITGLKLKVGGLDWFVCTWHFSQILYVTGRCMCPPIVPTSNWKAETRQLDLFSKIGFHQRRFIFFSSDLFFHFFFFFQFFEKKKSVRVEN